MNSVECCRAQLNREKLPLAAPKIIILVSYKKTIVFVTIILCDWLLWLIACHFLHGLINFFSHLTVYRIDNCGKNCAFFFFGTRFIAPKISIILVANYNQVLNRPPSNYWSYNYMLSSCYSFFDLVCGTDFVLLFKGGKVARFLTLEKSCTTAWSPHLGNIWDQPN